MIIVVTGGIGSGKSSVCRILCDKYSMALYDADSKVKSLYDDNPSIVTDLEEALACRLTDECGCFVPVRLADRIFSDPEALETVESIVFPALMEDFDAFNRSVSGHVVFESATILEKEQFKGFGDVVILVDAPIDIRIERACRRDSASKEKVIARMNHQQLMNEVSKYGLSAAGVHVDAVIVNDGTFDQLEQEVSRIMTDVIK